MLAAAGRSPVWGQRGASPRPQDLALPRRRPAQAGGLAPDLAGADGGSAVPDSVTAREEGAGETGWVPGGRADRAQEADR